MDYFGTSVHLMAHLGVSGDTYRIAYTSGDWPCSRWTAGLPDLRLRVTFSFPT
jgi:hypothetical protein